MTRERIRQIEAKALKALRRALTQPTTSPSQNTSMKIEDLGFSTSIYNGLKRSGVNTVGELVQLTARELLAIHGLRSSSLNEIDDALSALGLKLRADTT